MPAPNLATARLSLRQLMEADAPALHKALSDDTVMTWWSSPAHRSLEETAAYIGWNARPDDGHLCWAITRTGDDEALGWVILIPKREGVMELGYILRRDQWGQGIAREAVMLVLGHGFGAMNLRRIFADADPDNAGSIALLTSLGFRQEGHLRAEWETHLGIRDSLIYGLLREEYVQGEK
jgi:[ribosomal protein S5]-alanine N-acetyltransferase